MNVARRFAAGLCVAAWAALPLAAHGEPSREAAGDALRRAVEYYRAEVSAEGGYLWRYSEDLKKREGEGKASPTTVWVQPPGTPSVGLAYLAAHELTGDDYYLEAAVETAHALVRGQLQSGGWDYRIEFAPEDRKRHAYRADGNTEGGNKTTLDDNVTQQALRCLMLVDQALNFKDGAIHEAALYALEKLMAAQYPNGAWPQRFTKETDPDGHPVKPASYPENWPKTYPDQNYQGYYTLNDNTQSDMIEVMLMAGEIYGKDRYTASGKRGGDFLVLAQMPEPQPGWAQQYNAEMHPAWARKFEPASITGGESQGAMRTLLRVYELTGDRKYLEPLPRAIAYYRSSVLDNGELARFYELKTNKPLYFTKDYEVTYSDADMPTHYAFKVGNGLDAISAKYERLASTPEGEWEEPRIAAPAAAPRMTDDLQDQAAAIIKAQNEKGAWVEPARGPARFQLEAGEPALEMRTYVANIRTLANYIAAKK